MARQSRYVWTASPRGKSNRNSLAAPHRRRLRFESLEDRKLLSVTVDTLVDENNGSAVGGTSLRDAIAEAMPGETILFSVTGTIELEHGALLIDKNLTIDGPGADSLIIDAQLDSRVFNINDSNAGNLSEVTLRDLTITGGSATNGGGIWSLEQLTVSNATIAGNSADELGGGLLNDGGIATIFESTITGNTAAAGGGIAARFGGEVNVERTTIDSNMATGFTLGFNSGGGIHNDDSTVNVVASTISGNSADYGAGLYSRGGLTVAETVVRNSTLSGNIAAAVGGGIYNFGGHLVVEFSTITSNEASAEGDGMAIWADSEFTLNEFRSSIIVGNSDSDVDLVGGPLGSPENTIISNDFNAVFSGNAVFSFDGIFDIEVPPELIDLGPLTDNGGPTKTHALLFTSPAINAGDFVDSPLVAYDQRGVPFDRRFDPNGVGIARMDIGAFEAEALYLIVDTIVDENNGIFAGLGTSLRDALEFVNLLPDFPAVVQFARELNSGGPATIELEYGQLNIGSNVTITGPGAGLLTIDAQQASRVFNVDDGNPGTLKEVVICGSTITGGVETNSGGGIFNNERLTLTESVVTSNEGTYGGGIYNNAEGELTIVGSTVSGNTATESGGGVYNWGGDVDILQSTISGNTAAVSGGGIVNANFGPMTIGYSTITKNRAVTGFGGGIADAATTVIRHTIVADNFHSVSDRSDVIGLVEAHFSLIGDDTGALIHDVEGSLIGSRAAPINPLLGPLADNGGPTKTHALLTGSLAIDAGDSAASPGDDGVPTVDQRGTPFGRVRGAAIDIGAFEVQSAAIVPELLGDYNLDEVVDAADYTVWRNTLGDDVVRYEGADGNGNELIDAGDYGVWRQHYGDFLPPPGGGGLAAAASVPERAADSIASQPPASPEISASAPLIFPASSNAKPPAAPGAIERVRVVASQRFDALIAWIAESRQIDSDGELVDVGSLGETDAKTSIEGVDAAFVSFGDDELSTLGDSP